jgi:K+/H+ antiporter YhaU regulatory subunit KhtT
VEFLELVSRYDHVDTEIGDIIISEESALAGKTIRESGIRSESGVLILAIAHPGEQRSTNPSPETVIRAGDELIVMGTSKQVDAAERLAAGS